MSVNIGQKIWMSELFSNLTGCFPVYLATPPQPVPGFRELVSLRGESLLGDFRNWPNGLAVPISATRR